MNIIKLKIISGPMNEEEFLLHTNRSILLGREDCCDIKLTEDNFISRKHAIIFVIDSKIYIDDLKSRNSIIVNGNNINGLTLLNIGDVIKVGNSEILVEILR